MAETIMIQSGTFRAELVLSELHRLPMSNWRKICQILAANEETVHRLRTWFPLEIACAKITLNLSRTAFEAGYKDTRKVPKDKQHEQMLLNAELRKNRSCAMRRLENLKRQHEIFEQITKEI